MKFKHIVCGGTFDHIHAGHKKLLDECILNGEKVTVGVATKALSRHKAYLSSLETYSKRVENVTSYNTSLNIYKLTDIFGPTLVNTSIDAICVTEDTVIGANLINEKRLQIGMKPLFIIRVPFVYDETNEKISSERIRQGVISREGLHYYKYLTSKDKFILPETLREVLRKPLGRIIPSISTLSEHIVKKMRDTFGKHSSVYCCTVGDMVTFELKKRGILPHISVVDHMTQRKALNSMILQGIIEKGCSIAKNEKGTIQKEAVIALHLLFSQNEVGHKRATKQLLIQGEEDLLTLVAVLLAPLHSHIWYGQQGIGAIHVKVTEKMKQRVYNLLCKFS